MTQSAIQLVNRRRAMPIRELPPSVYVVCDGCSRSLNTGSTDYDYTVFDAVEMPAALMDYDWCVTKKGEVLCHECSSITAGIAPDSFQDRDREERDPRREVRSVQLGARGMGGHSGRSRGVVGRGHPVSERLRMLDEAMAGESDCQHDQALFDALPALVALVEAAEKVKVAGSIRPFATEARGQLDAALSALSTALPGVEVEA